MTADANAISSVPSESPVGSSLPPFASFKADWVIEEDGGGGGGGAGNVLAEKAVVGRHLKTCAQICGRQSLTIRCVKTQTRKGVDETKSPPTQHRIDCVLISLGRGGAIIGDASLKGMK